MNSYYKDKAKDSEEQTTLLIWLVIIFVVLGAGYCTVRWVTHKCLEPLTPRDELVQVTIKDE